MIHVQPAVEQRQSFAMWAVTQKPKVRTVGPHTFSVPPALFTRVPERVLIGALVDGHRYLSPEEDRQEPAVIPRQTDPTLTELDAFPESVTASGGSRAGTAPSKLGEPHPASPDTVGPAPTPAIKQQGGQGDTGGGPYACTVCSRDFATARGRDTHHRRAHTAGGPVSYTVAT